MLPNFLHAQVEEVDDYSDGYSSHYEVVLMVGSHEVVRLDSNVPVSYRDGQSDRQEVIADTLREFFSGNLSAMQKVDLDL